MNDFESHRPSTIEEALAALAASDDARALAGGQSLLPSMKLGLAAPADLVDLSGIEGLREISATKSLVKIGAMATHAQVAAADAVQRTIPALARLADGIGDPAIREVGTIGGSLANNDPAACYPAAALALGATIHTDRREIAADAFFTGLYETALEPGELITAVSFPIPRASGYEKFKQPASGFALVGVFVARSDSGVRAAVTGSAACVFRSAELESALGSDWSPSACEKVAIPADGLNGDIHASAAYRAQLIRVLAARAVRQAG